VGARLAATLLAPGFLLLPWDGLATERPALDGQVAAAAPLAFAHADHVPPRWYAGKPESRRDCRGCHVYSASALPVDPQVIEPEPNADPARRGCDVCHARPGGKFAMVASPAFAAGLGPLREQGSVAFEHGEHLRLACRACHLPAGVVVVNRRTFDPLPIQAGSNACGSCHKDGGRRDFEVVAGEQLAEVATAESLTTAGFARVLDQRLRRPVGRGKFRHQDHLADPGAPVPLVKLLGAGADATCTVCHATAAALGNAEFAAARFKPGACGACHVGARGPIRFAADAEAGTSLSGGTFRHGDHIRAARKPDACSAEARRRLDDEGCRACHGLRADAEGFDAWQLLDVGGAGTAASAYEGCVVCHTPQAWRTSEHGRWERCENCHVFPSANVREARPLVKVTRSRNVRFAIDVQAHRHITGASRGDPAAADCRPCHRAPVARLPSRIGGRAFDHAVHPTDCSRCHAAVAGAKSPADLGISQVLADGGTGSRSFDLARCGDCHEGGAVVVAKEEFASTDAPLFSHADHVAPAGQPDKLRKNGEPMTCVVCHEPVEGGRSFGVPEPKSCATCHGHDGRRAPETRDFGAAAAGSCGKCHGDGVPAKDAVVAVARQRVGGYTGGQVHDPALTDNKACNVCHLAAEPVLLSGDHVFAAAGWRMNDEERHRGDADLVLPPERVAPSHCEGCHWQATEQLQQVHRRGLPAAGVIEAPTDGDRAGAMGMNLSAFPGPRATPFVAPR